MQPCWRYSAVAPAAPQTQSQVHRPAAEIRRREMPACLPVVRRSAELHLDHITRGGDPFEMLEARPLDFGHWSAHKLEAMSDFRLRHGEAVAIGIVLDAFYAWRIGLIDAADFDALASSLIARKLHPEARLFFPGSREESVRRMLESGFIELEELKEIVGRPPRPPRATTTRWPFSTRSARGAPSPRSWTSVPTGTRATASSPAAPAASRISRICT